MNSTSMLEMKTAVRSKNRKFNPITLLRIKTYYSERSRTETSKRSNGSSSLTESKPRIGEAVRHSRYGKGQVLAHRPDGTLLIRFNNSTKNRLVWPSFLDRPNGQRR